MNFLSAFAAPRDLRTPVLKLQLIVNPAMASGSLTTAMLNLAAIGMLNRLTHWFPNLFGMRRCPPCHA